MTEKTKHGKQENQKMKPYLVLDYLLKNSDENNIISCGEIQEYLFEDCGICSERRGIYSDINAINEALVMLENACNIKEAKEILFDESEKIIAYDKKAKGYYVSRRKYEVDDIRFLAECVYAAKFIDEEKAKYLVDAACEQISIQQAETIRHDVYTVGRVKTENKDSYFNVSFINAAMTETDDRTPKKITFNYLRYSINDLKQEISRSGKKYVVSPYKFIINDGNYYLLAFEDERQKMLTFRVDRMKNIKITNEERDGEKEFKKIDLKTYTQRVFSMFSGTLESVRIKFDKSLLDTMIDRFGKKCYYSKAGGDYYIISTEVEISEQFFSWVCGFGTKVIIETPKIAKQYAAFLDGIRELYN